jgi:Na+/H+ antiporter NhaD/arsenite permease-like protein
MKLRYLVPGLALAACPDSAHASDALDGSAMPWTFVLPFGGLLLCIALGPLLFPRIWHAHYGKISAAWAVLSLVLVAGFAGVSAMVAALTHALLAEYLSFIVLLFALYTVAGGVVIAGDIKATPRNNTAFLALGAAMASVTGTTGAAMILIRPLIRANRGRPNTHVVIFFIILVANVGGALSPLGDPPLFVGFLRGVDFFWTAKNLWMQTAIVVLILLVVFCALDVWHGRGLPQISSARPVEPVRIRGAVNLALMVAIIGCILGAAAWKSGVSFDFLGTRLELQNLVRDGALIVIALLSLWLTPGEHRDTNDFTWGPIKEVAKLFACIFVAIVPVVAMLAAGRDGPFAGLLAAVTGRDGAPHQVAYFWLTGVLSAFLDNAPTYLMFFELAGGNSQHLMGEFAGTLAAISMGAVYMGALTYIGNAPNFMVYAIAVERGVKMPGFFGYMMWAGAILIPLFLLLTFLPIAPVFRLQ